MKVSFTHLEEGRLKDGYLKSKPGDHYGAFVLSHKDGRKIYMIADDGKETGWEHVSVTVMRKHRGKIVPLMPDWNLMCMVKGLFWDDNETVVQFHPPKDDYVNNHPFCLHLWKSTRQAYLLPPKGLV